jgi:hypothetical protein
MNKELFALPDVYILNERDREFVASFGSSSKPISLGEFLIFWNSLSDEEQREIVLDYDNIQLR